MAVWVRGPQNHAFSPKVRGQYFSANSIFLTGYFEGLHFYKHAVVNFEGLDAVVVPERSLFSFSSEVDSPSVPPSPLLYGGKFWRRRRRRRNV